MLARQPGILLKVGAEEFGSVFEVVHNSLAIIEESLTRVYMVEFLETTRVYGQSYSTKLLLILDRTSLLSIFCQNSFIHY